MTRKNAEVERWLKGFDHPLKDAILQVREIVLGADRRVEECIKWKSPTFTYQGNMASINPNTKKKVSLMFHKGAEIPGRHPGLVGGGGTVKYMYFESKDEVKRRRSEIELAIRAWCTMRAEDSPQKAATRPAAPSPRKQRATGGKQRSATGRSRAGERS